MSRTDEETLEELLRETFAGARARGGLGTDSVTSGIAQRVARLRRRRAAMRAGLLGVAAATVAFTLVGTGALAGLTREGLVPASDSGSAPHVAHSRLDAAYAVPDALPDPLPNGLRPLGTTGQQTDRPELLGNQGGCAWQDDVRRPVAGRQWQLTDPAGGGFVAGVSVAGFVTGTGSAAMTEFRTRSLACNLSDVLEPSTWAGHADADHFLAEGARGLQGVGGDGSVALALVRRGDLLVSGFSSGTTASQARDTATTLALGAANRLTGFAPADGLALGTSTEASNDASATPIASTEPNAWQNAYPLDVTWPKDGELPGGAKWAEVAHQYPNVPAAMDVQLCDPSEVAARRGGGQETGPGPISGVNRSAWTGDGTGKADTVVTVTITGWAKGTGPARFADLRDDTGRCIYFTPQVAHPWAGHAADDALLSETKGALDEITWLAAQRVGDLIVSVVVRATSDSEGARSDAARLSDTLARDLRTSGMPAAKGR